MEKLITAKQRNLLINSTICDENTDLKNVLSKYEKGLTINQIEKIKCEIGELYYKLSSKEIIKNMLDDAGQEWIQEKPVGIVEQACDLCKNAKSKEKFIIRNRVNNKKLLVGSSCIEKFSEIKRTIRGEKLSDIIKLNGAKFYIYERLAKFNKMYEGGKEIIDNWGIFYNDFDIVFPYEIENEFEKLNKKARKFYKDYKNAVIPEDDLIKFEYYIKDFEYLKRKILNFKEENKENKFLCTKEIAEELKERQLNKVLEKIKNNNSIIEAWQIKYIGNTNFIKQFYSDIEEYLKENKVKLLEIKNKKIIGEINSTEFNNLKIEMNTSLFAKDFDYLINKEKVKGNKDFISNSSIVKEKSNIFRFVHIIARSMRRYKYYVDIDDDMYEFGYLKIYRGNKFVMVEIDKILKAKNLFIERSFKEIISYIKDLEWEDIINEYKYDIGSVGRINSGNEYIYTAKKNK